MEAIKDLIAFWHDDVGAERWYNSTPELDEEILSRYSALWQKAQAGGCDDWAETPVGALALVILFDQLPRNMFRGSRQAFATDAQALKVATMAVEKGFDMQIEDPLRQFFYVPFMHSEKIADQEKGVLLAEERMPDEHLQHAKAHHAIIARFGRFPWRNELVGRYSSDEEAAFLWAGGYERMLASVGGR
ncbi:uncharacterized protein (DUF924 family) [Rhodobacter aestuarii]|uniref:Uncharacterized conserved protein, DUF924 family n=1 Tax=Rhodobacter aestuarii TaxID=453582 RepID=A0A1N7J7E9_9RHOB|nr:DUF924 family protein [Rhodobacter aestuarii]PTV97103.1 uncharacterized protein (DUF924 family) [Rhodobacter aestuarii]SIS45242.1 Uncharacterized conserved protein, DUF924 family [Rhodobacter aestuarii]